MFNVYLFQPQYSKTINGIRNYWLPYSVGLLWSYALQSDVVRENFSLKEMIFKREDPEDILDRMHDPKVCGFSAYVWSNQYCLELAKRIKQRWPDCVIVFGGPNTSTGTLNNKFVDHVILAEGEQSFTTLLENIANNITSSNIFLKSRLQDLDIPSPYLNGLFDDIIKQYPNSLFSMTIETNRGCPYACTFCDWGGTTYSKVKRFDLSHIQAELDWATKNPIGFMYCADANFGMFRDRDIEIAKMIRKVADDGQLESVIVQYAKNSTDHVFEIAKILGDIGKGITVSVQSMNEPTLVAVKRKNLDVNDLKKIMRLSREHRVNTYTELILGLPEETLETWKDGFSEILEMGQHDSIDIWMNILLENCEMNTFESRVKYGIKSIIADDYAPFSDELDYKGVKERISLVQSTSTMTLEDMIEAYVYGFMVIRFHSGGYTQYYAKYCRNVLGIPYRQYYDRLYEIVTTDETFKEYFDFLRKSIGHFLTTGKLLDKQTNPVLVDSGRARKNFRKSSKFSNEAKWFYDNKQHAYEVGQSCLKQFTDDVTKIDDIQQQFIYDPKSSYPLNIEVDWDLETWEPVKSFYQIATKNQGAFDFNKMQTKGYIKNIFERNIK